MKQLVFAFFFIAIGAATHAQVKAVETARIKTPDALCQNCKERIEAQLKRYVGIISTNVNFRKGETIVKFYKDRLNIETVKAAIANAGYEADGIAPTEDMYELLPASCKKQSDGGHPDVKKPRPQP